MHSQTMSKAPSENIKTFIASITGVRVAHYSMNDSVERLCM